MASIQFPVNPSNGEIYTINNRYWRWDGVSWNSIINDDFGNFLYNDNGNANTSNVISISNNTLTISNVSISVLVANGTIGTNGQILAANGTGIYWVDPLSFSGFSGWSGISGFSGFSGFSGESGFSGWSGISGFSGYSGIDGTVGGSGFSGWSGESGFSGWSGISGFSGWSGESGFSGFSGTSGFSGWSGISGFSGYSGAQPAFFVISSNTTANTGDRYLVDGNDIVVTLPLSPNTGDVVGPFVAHSNSTSNCTIARNSANIMGLAEDLTIDVFHFSVAFSYSGNTEHGWRLV